MTRARIHPRPSVCNPKVTAEWLSKLCALRPRLAIVLGSGFAEALPDLKVVARIPYAKLPGFPKPDVSGHMGQAVMAESGSTPVLLLLGRSHFYEGHPMEAVTFPVRVLAEFGIRDLLLTNAAGGINRRFHPGDFMVLTDHINFMGENPLCGGVPPGRERFVDLSQAYDERLTHLLQFAARKVKLRLHAGVYLAVSGPSFETPAEIRAFARLGADAVGMSTVPEVIVARQCGLAVAGLSCITNLAAGCGQKPLSHAEVLAMGRQVGASASQLLTQFIQLYAQSRPEDSN
jgi:purine-nucleoside phosphorylase